MNNKLSSCENIVTLVKDIALEYLKTTEEYGCLGEEVVVSDMHECIELCDKLLTNDYFEKSESYLEKNHDILSDLKFYKVWLKLYNKDVKKKKKDVSKLFKIVVRNIEEI